MNLGIVTLWTADEMSTAMANLQQAADAVNASVGACAALDAASKTGWAGFYQTVSAFAAPANRPAHWWDTSGTQADELQAFQRELQAWQAKLSAKCPVNVGLVAPPPAVGPQVENAIKWAAIGVGAIAVAVVVSKVAHELDMFRGTRAA